MEKTNAETPRTASGQPNVGLFVGFNLPIYHKKLAAGVQEAQARAAADGQLFEAEETRPIVISRISSCKPGSSRTCFALAAEQSAGCQASSRTHGR